MAEFAPNKPVTSEEPVGEVDKGLPVGVHVFQLQVEDNLGQVSEAVAVKVTIVKEINPLFPPFFPPIRRPPG